MTYQNQSLEQLQIDCQQQIKTYQKNSSSGEKSLSCLEIVRRAANYAQDALAVMLELSRPFIYARCKDDFYAEREDIAQDVYMRLIKKFNDRIDPFEVSDFAGFRHYVNLTAESVILNIVRRRKKEGPSPDDPGFSHTGYEPDMAGDMTLQEQVQRVLDLLNKPLEREAILRRYVYGESIDKIVKALSVTDPDITKKQVSRLLERGKERLRKDPRLRHLMGL